MVNILKRSIKSYRRIVSDILIYAGYFISQKMSWTVLLKEKFTIMCKNENKTS